MMTHRMVTKQVIVKHCMSTESTLFERTRPP